MLTLDVIAEMILIPVNMNLLTMKLVKLHI